MRNIHDVDLKYLRVFVAVANSGGFTAAENRLNLNCASISKYIAELETRLGVKLCKRGRSGFALTPEGEKLYQSSNQLLVAINTCVADLHNIGQKVNHRIRIGIIDNTAQNRFNPIPDALFLLRSEVANLNIELNVLPASEIVFSVLKGDLDIGVTLMPRKVSGLKFRALYVEDVCPYVSTRHREFSDARSVSLDELADFSIATYEFRDISDILSERGNIKYCPQLDAVALLTLSGQHVGMLPSFYAEHWVQRKMLKALDVPGLGYRSTIHAITKGNASQDSVISRFLDFATSLSKQD